MICARCALPINWFTRCKCTKEELDKFWEDIRMRNDDICLNCGFISSVFYSKMYQGWVALCRVCNDTWRVS